MSQPDSINQQFELAIQFVNNTAQNIFLTGKAGTGKTTFLKFIKENTHKKLVVTAPTGIAAINAGGVTLHSFFQLPFGSFVPSGSMDEVPSGNFFNKNSLLKHLRFKGEKRRIIQELDLLIIDEVSMVRSDLLDAVDVILRHIRKQVHLPFGGVQMLFIGDLLQLPPVVNEDDWRTLKQYYASPFFFDTQVLCQHPPHYIELKKIYRQSDENFIRVLNRLRNNELQLEDLDLLNSYYRPDFKAALPGEYVTLTTHNSKAEEINQRELKNLSGKMFEYNAEVTGDFNEKSVMAEVTLKLKEGAQVMFIKNDKGEKKRFFNGKLATVARLENQKIFVTFPETSGEIEVEKETWKNIRYNYSKEYDAIQEEELGTFTQFPLRLAWAITIHKSQGLTFSKAIVDAGESFAPGQVYVALSRLTSLDGLVLHSLISASCINTDQQALDFALCERDNETLLYDLKNGQKDYVHTLLINTFNMNFLTEILDEFHVGMLDRRLSFLDEATAMAKNIHDKLKILGNTADKFIRQLEGLLPDAENDNYTIISARVEAAGKYFSEAIRNEILDPMKDHYEMVKNKQKAKKYLLDVALVIESIGKKYLQLEQAVKLTSGLATGTDPSSLLSDIRNEKKNSEQIIKVEPVPKKKMAKGDTQKLTLSLYRQGKTIVDIAKERGMAASTIEGHLASFIPTGEVQMEEIVTREKMGAIIKVIEEMGDAKFGAYKEVLGEKYSYAEIKIVAEYLKEKDLEEILNKE